ncbi:SchA/CurD-like domain-containing protein [Actinomadura craniellae]|nr:SchA/CurD-like domain-containing protein [Actinomadura craniellae]
MERHALAFRIRPGSHEAVRELLAGYGTPRLETDDGTRLLSTAVFLKDDLAVRAIEIEGDLPTLAAHLAQDPVVLEVERGLLPHLVDTYDPADPRQRGEFMARRRTEPLMHCSSSAEGTGTRHALRYPVRPDRMDRAAAFLAGPGDLARVDTLHGASVFRQGDDVLVGVFEIGGDIDGFVEDLARAVPVGAAREMAEIFEAPGDFATAEGRRKFYTESLMTTVTDRRVGR